jgi:hypothetical protein
MQNHFAERNMVVTQGPYGENWELMTFPDGLPPDAEYLGNQTLRAQGGEVLETISDDDYWDWLQSQADKLMEPSDPMSTVFNVIRLTPEVKAKFLKEGMPMYGMAGLGGGEAIKQEAERKRGPDGRFSK